MKIPFAIVLLVLSLVLLLPGCTSSTNEETKESINEEVRGLIFADLADKYKAVRGWHDTIYNYTIEYQNLISDTSQLYTLEGLIYIKDIYKKDSRFYIFGVLYQYPFYCFRLECSENQITKILNDINGFSFSYSCLVVKINDVKNLNLEIVAMVEDEYSAFIDLDYSKNIIIHGYLIDFYFDKN